MNSSLSINPSFSTPLRRAAAIHIHRPPHILLSHRKILKKPHSAIKSAASGHHAPPPDPPRASTSPLKAAACAVILAAAAFGRFPLLPPAMADVSTASQTLTEDSIDDEIAQQSPLNELLQSNPDAVDALKKLLQEKLEAGEDEESLSILKKLSSAQPENLEYRFMIARVLNEMGKVEDARDAFEEILARNPLSYEALFENALLMDRSGEREAVMRRLEDALRVAEDESKAKEARDVKLIMAQMQFLRKEVDEALRSYDELEKEDPSDFRPYFCKGMIYSLMDKNVEAREQFAKYKELSPKKFEVEGYLRTPLSRMKLFGTDEGN